MGESVVIALHGSWASTLCSDLVHELDLGVGFVPPRESSHASMVGRVGSFAGRGRFVDFQWHRDAAFEPDWIQETYGARSALRSSTAHRSMFFRRVATDFPDGPVVAVSGNVNDGRRSREYARELVQIRDAEFSGRPVMASFVLDRQGLTDHSILADLNPLPRGVDGVALSIQDAAIYPSIWTYDDWYGWLRLIRGFVEAGYDVILPYSDVRGLVGVGVGAREFGTGPQQDLRQLRPAQQRQETTGAQPSVSYVSIPLLSIVHGSRAGLEAEWHRIESHAQSSVAFGRMGGLHSLGSSFDDDWTSSGRPRGELTNNRISQHIRALAAAEEAILANSTADAVEAQLEEAVALGTTISQDVFKNPGSRAELDSRLQAFRSVRRDLAF